MNIRIGQGFDVHAFGEGDHIMLGGVRISYHQGFVAHSDGDVLIHALCDALLGALALGDIGQHFPDDQSEYAGIDSKVLLRRVYALVRERGYTLINLDSVIMAQAPKLAAHIPAMCQSLANELQVEITQIGIKATTTEHLGFTGRKEGIAVSAVVLLNKVEV